MSLAYSKSSPVAPDFPTFSDPAKSTKYNLLFIIFYYTLSVIITLNIVIACEREETAFMLVLPIFLLLLPNVIIYYTSNSSTTHFSVTSSTYIPSVGDSLIFSFIAVFGFMRSRISSMYISIIETLKMNSISSLALFINSNIPYTALGIIPLYSSLIISPCIVCVLPDDV